MFSEEIIFGLSQQYTAKINSIELLGASHNTVYKINCDSPFILRLTSEHHRSKDELLGEIYFLQFLKKNGVSVAAPIPSRTNDILTEHHSANDTVYVVAFTIADGLQWYERADNFYFKHIGQELGRIHKASRSYHAVNCVSRRQYTESQHLVKAATIFEKHSPALGKAFATFMHTLSLLPKNSENFGLIHGDFLLSNYNITEGNKVTIYDFDECEYSWFISDIATLMYYQLTGGDPSQTANRKDEAIEAILKIMSGYLKENNLPVTELKQLDLFFKLRDYVLLSMILGCGNETLGSWDGKLVPMALDRVLNDKPFVDIDYDLIIKQLSERQE